MKITEEHKKLLHDSLNATKSEGLTRFMTANRRTGSTTALVEAAIKADGYLIVGNLKIRECIMKCHPGLNPERVLTIQQVRNNSWSFDPRPVFIDTTAVWGMK